MENKNAVETGVIDIIQSQSSGIITPDILLVDLHVNSITFIKIVVELEAKFDIEFQDEKLLITEFPAVKDFIDYICEII